ncbi:short chain enoyl-CoA hydratase [Melghirimyces profundicolus]|uniref:Short chain enoyl-CoA hydratase n=1 Tax=Melghirimyces profundicolus TaxID=1242148 RepID=A0A2T6C7C5_9BACL|nr:enoyl-CoA hydratase-related protein [Melghirimyces profundicolus]PTX64231.1 short chain enoyl-CoA hydratase [Melghirimyces profundicolus]
MDPEFLRVSTEKGVGRIELRRPKVLNALNRRMVAELVEMLESFDREDTVGAILLTGGPKAFAAGADIDEMAGATAAEMLTMDPFADWDRIRRVSKPIVAAVNGYALGGGCELAMACDLIFASETARFGQPEIDLGVMPGAGGTQRLTRAVGKARAMEMVLTGKPITAKEAYAAGLINRVVPAEVLEEEAMKMARELASKPPVALRLAKRAVQRAAEIGLEAGLDYEQKLFYFLFSTEDQKEGMQAFMEKRRPEFRGK